MDSIEIDQLILHPGSPKTGTSGLQNFLDRNRDILRGNGYLYPRAGIPVATGTARGQHDLAQRLSCSDPVSNSELAAIFEMLRSEIKLVQPHTVILSSEELFGASRVKALSHLLRPKRCHVYVCLRPQHEVLNANYYTQVTHNRITHPPEVYFDYAISRLRYLENMQAFSSFCQNTTVSLRVFEKGTLVRRSPIQDFITETNLPLSLVDSDNLVEHPTLPAQATLFLRWLNELEFDRQSFFDIFEVLHKIRTKLPPCQYTMSPARIESIIETFENENRVLRRLFLDGQDAPIFSEAEIPSPQIWNREVGEDYRRVERRFLRTICLLATQEN